MDYEKSSIAWLLKSLATTSLLKLLAQIEGEKDLCVSSTLIQPLDLLVNFSTLKNFGVRKLFILEDKLADGVLDRLCYVVTTDAATTRIIANQINSHKNNPSFNRYWIIYIPRMLKICDLILEEQGVHGLVTIFELPLTFIPLDTDLFSLEQEDLFETFFLKGNQSIVYNIVTAITQLRKTFGQIKCITGLGRCAQMSINLFETYSITESLESHVDIDHLIVVDRNIDYASLLLSPLNYQGLLDDIFGFKCSKIEIPSSVVIKEKLESKKCFFQSNDAIFRHIRDLHISTASTELKTINTNLKLTTQSSKEMNLQEMKSFVQNELQAKKAIHKHISMCEAIMDKKKEIEFRSQMEVERNIIEGSDYRESIQYLEEIIIRQVCPLLCLRLLSLLSLIQDGLPSKDYYNLVRLFLQSFGHHYLMNIFRLKQLGLLNQQNQPKLLAAVNPKVTNVLSQTKVAAAAISALPRKSHFRNVIKRLNLCPDSASEASKTKDCSFIFGGNYVPLIYKIVDLIIVESTNLVDNLKIVSNHVIHKRLDCSDQAASRKKVVVVFFIGGMSYAEVSALRFLGRQKNIEIMMCCSSIINGNRLMSLTNSSNGHNKPG